MRAEWISLLGAVLLGGCGPSGAAWQGQWSGLGTQQVVAVNADGGIFPEQEAPGDVWIVEDCKNGVLAVEFGSPGCVVHADLDSDTQATVQPNFRCAFSAGGQTFNSLSVGGTLSLQNKTLHADLHFNETNSSGTPFTQSRGLDGGQTNTFAPPSDRCKQAASP